ncbi:hypothetical protein BFL28_15025 [Sphingomonas turrisvirgatae]|uniref:DUF429 domain-containing protein n=1 Tax=Sphingomonas turrisvirgatae TaxID=1888892 RepID=A0A1E3LWV9_9SPHN|nr:hypothetical protein [Sphingomonas turrisvirgatae]ODP38281.1 hypothetical protein BFL28_15025 [Sphingomonas turrisvirgatae]
MSTDRFARFAAIDWSGAKGSRHPGIALAVCGIGNAAPALVAPPTKAWSRTAIGEWIEAHADEPLLIGFDMSFCAPILDRGAYLPGESSAPNARAFWAYVDANSPDEDLGAASFLDSRRGRHFYLGAADGPKADFMHFRRCEQHFNASGGGKVTTVYDAIGAAQVAKASFAGMRLLHRLSGKVAIWPFDPVPPSGAVIVEIYTAIAARAAGLRKGRSKIRDAQALDEALAQLGSRPHMPLARHDDHSTDAILTAAWLRANAGRHDLWHPPALTPEVSRTEGWTFGIS